MRVEMKCGMTILLIVFLLNNCFGQSAHIEKNKRKIIIEFVLTNDKADSLKASYLQLGVPTLYDFQNIKTKVNDRLARFKILSDKPVFFDFKNIIQGHSQDWNWLLEPGDSVRVLLNDTAFSFAGRGYKKLELQNRLYQIRMQVKNPGKKFSHVQTLEEFLVLHQYLKVLLGRYNEVFELYKPEISAYAYQYLRTGYINEIVYFRSFAFQQLIRDKNISRERLCTIYDSTFSNRIEKSALSNSIGPEGDYSYIQTRVYRRLRFNADSLEDKATRKILYYEEAKRTYKGLVLEQYLLDLLTYFVIKKLGFTSETEYLIAKYYKEPGFHEFKKFLKDYETNARVLRPGSKAPDFSLTDFSCKVVNNAAVTNKVVLMDFWFTGCLGCIQMTPALRSVEAHFKGDSNIVFLSVCIDKDKEQWNKSVQQKKYTTGTSLNVYTGGHGKDDSIIKRYNVLAYPSLCLLDGDGKIVVNPVPDPRNDNGVKLINLISRQLTYLKDGPYVNENKNVISFYGSSLIQKRIDDSNEIIVATDSLNKELKVKLKTTVTNEPVLYLRPARLLALSDIEGNFDALRKLLQANGVIDEDFNWTFGKGHLVFSGDMFDRGKQVTECLWLIYSLEDKAKAAGGYVHFILGNHEIMNMSGDHDYTQAKYLRNAEKLGQSYSSLYGAKTELGKWLRSKNIIESIGDILFVHGGIGKEVLSLNLSLEQINTIGRSYYDKSDVAEKSNDKVLSVLYNSKETMSPFWHRAYYLDEPMKVVFAAKGPDTLYKTSMNEVDKVLARYNVNHIVTGHTIPKDQTKTQVTVHYDNKVINTDTYHAGGFEWAVSEALLVEGNKFYRVNDKGERHLLFVDDKRKGF